MTQFMFGMFKVPATCVAIQVGLSPYATRRATRIVMDSCDVVSHRVETYRTEMGNLMAHDITFQVE